jgi:hypothetical protein
MPPHSLLKSREHVNPVRSFGEREGEVCVSKMLEGGRSRHIYMLLRSQKKIIAMEFADFSCLQHRMERKFRTEST